MKKNTEILGCFISGPTLFYDADEKAIKEADKKGELFEDLVWSKNGLFDKLKVLKHKEYGKDLELILFQYYLNPMPTELKELKEIESYRKKEKSIGVTVIVTDKNFFDRTLKEKKKFLKQSILDKLNLLKEAAKKKKLDTDIEALNLNVEELLIKW